MNLFKFYYCGRNRADRFCEGVVYSEEMDTVIVDYVFKSAS